MALPSTVWPRTVTRTLVSVGALTGLAAAFVAGTSFGSSGDHTPWVSGGGGADVTPAAYAGSDLSLADSCEDLVAWYVERGLDRVGPWGWGGDPNVIYDFAESSGSSAGSPVPPADGSVSGEVRAPAAGPAPVRSTSEDTGTNVQEAGVDEPDVVKTDGRTLFRVEDGELVTYDVTGAEVERLASVDLPGSAGADSTELLLSGDTVVALSAHGTVDGWSYGYGTDPVPADTEVVTLDVSDPAAPTVTHTVEYRAGLVTARLHGGVVRVVLESGLPALDFEEPDRHTTEYEAAQANQDVVRASDIGDWLPTVSVDGGAAEQLLDCDQVAVPDEDAGLGTIAVVGFDAPAPEATSVTGLAVDTELAYASSDQLYLATTPAWDTVIRCADCRGPLPATAWDLLPGWVPGVDDEDGDGGDGDSDDGDSGDLSHLYAFDLDGIDTTFAAAGSVDGQIRDRWSLDAADGVLRVAVGPTWSTGGGNSVVTFRQEGEELVEAGRLDGLGVGEEIESVRWFDSLAILVTFEQTDPLYAVDLTDLDHPELMGELEIPGFSAYLHPLGEHRLLGLGEGPGADGAWGAQAGLFNVTDLTHPRRLDVLSFGPGSQALATQDPRQLTWLPDGRTVLTVIADYRTKYVARVAVLTLGDGEIEDRLVEVGSGDDAAGVRLVALADGRVVLVTGSGAEFFDL